MTNEQAKQIIKYLHNNEQVLINAAYEGMSVVDLITKVSQDILTSERRMEYVGSKFPETDPRTAMIINEPVVYPNQSPFKAPFYKDPLKSPLG